MRHRPQVGDVVIASLHDYGVCGAVQARHRAYAKGLIAEGVRVRLLALGRQSGHFAVPGVDTLHLSSGTRFHDRLQSVRRAVEFINDQHPQALILGVGVVPEVQWPLLTAADGGPTSVINEISEHPAVVANAGRATGLRLRGYRQHCLPKFDGLLPITEALRALLVPFANPTVVSEVLPALVDGDLFDPGSRASRAPGRIGYAGSLSMDKDGVDRLVEAVRILRTRPDCEHVTLDIYGEGQDQDRLQSLIQAHRMGSAVTLHGRIEQAELPAVYRRCSVLALARPDSVQARFGWPTKVAEYLASGTPTVVTPVGEIRRYLTDGQSAYLSASCAPEAVADALQRALTDPRRDEVAQAGRDVALSQFSPARGAQIILDVIEGCLARG